MKNKKNRVYSAEGDPDYGCTFIAAPTSRDARHIAMGTFVAEHLDIPYIEIRILWKRGLETDYEGELDIFQINELGLTWWDCPKCGKEDFEIITDREYQCKNCGNIEAIPYVG